MKNASLLITGLSLSLIACNSVKNESGNPVAESASTSNSVNLDYMDKSIRPQDDFFMFANGTWVKNNPVPASESRWGSFNELEQRNKKVLLEILNDVAKDNTVKGSDNQLLGDYYSSYVNMENRNASSMEYLNGKLSRIDQINSQEDLVSNIATLHKQGVRVLFGFGVRQDLKNVKGHISSFGQGGLSLPNKDFYLKENKAKIREEFVKYTAQILNYIKVADAENVANSILEFETKMAQGMMSPEEMRQPEKTYNKMSFKDFSDKFGNINWESYLMTVGSQQFDTLVVGQPDYIQHADGAIANFSLDFWKNYLKFKVVNNYAQYMNDDLVKMHFAMYGTTLSGKKEMKPIDERAIEHLTNQLFGEILGKKFVEKTFSESAKKRVNAMVDNLLISYRNRINALEWMSETTKKEAMRKLDAIGRKLVCPDKWEDYSSIAITPNNLIGNIDACTEYSVKDMFGRLYKEVDKSEWGMPAHMVNAYYSPLNNEIAFPAGIMQAPFFDEKAEDAVNYGRIGMVIGHEFTHGFDDSGSKFGADGTFNNWWSEADRKSFEERTKLLGETYKAFCPYEEHCVNPELTMGENIADLGGLTMAYYAYAMTDEFKAGKVVNGFTPAQRFFIAYAQLWKINYTPEELKNRIATDSHSPGMYRVNGPLKNCPEFFSAFGVKEGDKMRNSAEKISKIW